MSCTIEIHPICYSAHLLRFERSVKAGPDKLYLGAGTCYSSLQCGRQYLPSWWNPAGFPLSRYPCSPSNGSYPWTTNLFKGMNMKSDLPSGIDRDRFKVLTFRLKPRRNFSRFNLGVQNIDGVETSHLTRSLRELVPQRSVDRGLGVT